MKNLFLGCTLLLILLSGCETENNQELLDIQLQKETQKINSFIRNNPFPFEKEYSDPTLGIRVFWTEVSATGKKPNFGDTLIMDYVARRFDIPNWVLDTSKQSVAENMGSGFSDRDFFGPVKYIFGSSFGKLASGFEIVFPLMEEGDKVTAFFPSRYGNQNPTQTRITPNIPLIFELELLEIRASKSGD